MESRFELESNPLFVHTNLANKANSDSIYFLKQIGFLLYLLNISITLWSNLWKISDPQ